MTGERLPEFAWGDAAEAALQSDGSPVGAVAPRHVGDLCVDRTTPALYQATGTGNSDWERVGNGGSQPVYVQADDPGPVGVGKLWSDIATGALDWTQLSPGASPPARQGISLAYDAARGKVVLFGGVSDNGTDTNDTWTWDGTTWTEESPDHSPPAGADYQMVYDAARENIVLLVLVPTTTDPETWTWDGTDWTEESPDHSPSGRTDYGCAYDAARQKVILFGGVTAADSSYDNADTWEWDGTDWTQLSPATSPPGRACGRQFAYDAAREEIVLFGGYGDTGSGDDELGDTWTWDGTTWTHHTPTHSPSARTYMAMAWDPARQKIVGFGGQDIDAGPLNKADTWTWDGTDWTHESPGTSPSARYDMGITFDPNSGGLIVFGGNTDNNGNPADVVDETWEILSAQPTLKIRNNSDSDWLTVGS